MRWVHACQIISGAPIVYEAASGDAPARLSGGVYVPPSAFKPWDGHVGMVQADLSGLSLDYGEMGVGGDCGGNCTQFTKARLVFNNESQVLARWPNVGPAPVPRPPPPLSLARSPFYTRACARTHTHFLPLPFICSYKLSSPRGTGPQVRVANDHQGGGGQLRRDQRNSGSSHGEVGF